MIHFLKIKKTKQVRKKTGKLATRAIYVEKNYRMGKVTLEKTIEVTKPILVCGRHSSGKTRWLRRLNGNAKEIWAKQEKEPLFFNSTSSLSEWKDQEPVKEWWNSQSEKKWEKLSGHKQEKLLVDYASSNWTTIFIDNIDKLTGKKLDMIKSIIETSKSRMWIASSTAENRISPSLREIILRASPQQFFLNSPVSYDATNIFVMIACILLIMMGHIEVAVMVGFFRVLSRGMFATKQQ